MAAEGMRAGRLGSAILGEWGLADLVRAWRKYAAYRKTQAELNALSIREREDIGLAGQEMRTVAKEAVYGRR